MGKILIESFRWLFNKFIIFIFLLALIVGYTKIHNEWLIYIAEQSKIQDLQEEINRDERELKILRDKRRSLEQEVGEAAKLAIDILNLQIISASNKRQLLIDTIELLPPTKHIPGTEAYYTKLQYELEIKLQNEAIDRVSQLKTASINIHNAELIALTRVIEILTSKINSAEQEIERINNIFEDDLLHKIFKSVGEQIQPAFFILLGIILVPVGIKTFFFYVAAPLVDMMPAIQLIPNASDTINITNINKGNISSVSKAIILEKDEELSIRPEYIQDLPHHKSKKSTQCFINNRLPFSSISTGLFLLSRITTENSEPIIVSATKDPLMEVGVINLPNGSSLVSHPRSLVGVIHKAGEQINITKHWRLFSLQAWLTLQLRFLIIHGPCNLIVNGCRGVRIGEAREARMIDQSATLGFSANLNYKNTRSETFIPYFMGKENLFNDLFHGDQGIYVYDEMPDLRRKAGASGFDWFFDTVLKAFGL